MCEANVYLIDEKGDEKLIFEAVYSISDFLGGLKTQDEHFLLFEIDFPR